MQSQKIAIKQNLSERQQHSEGRIEIIMGPMFSGKSTELLRRMKRHEIAKKRVMLVKHTSDDRYVGSDTSVVTHDQKAAKATLIAKSLKESLLDSKAYEQADVIGIDEAQFFGEELPYVADQIAHHGKTVICAGLDGDINRNKFGHLIDLIPMAEKVKKMQAICVECGTTASFTHRHTVEVDTQKDEIVIVGG